MQQLMLAFAAGGIGVFFGWAWLITGDLDRTSYGRIAFIALVISGFLLWRE